MNNIKVSIIITCYNYGRFVADAINSALNQTYNNIEVIVVNDGSTDDSNEVITTFENKIIYINQLNSGSASALNNGISLATGEYIVALDADDWLSKTYIEDAVKLIDDEYTIISPIAYYTDENLNKHEYKHWPDAHVSHTNQNTFTNILQSNRASTSSLHSKKLWELVGGYDLHAVRAIDWNFWIDSIKCGGKIKYLLNGGYYKWRRHGPSKITSVSDDKLLQYIFKKHMNLDILNNRLESIRFLYNLILERQADPVGLNGYYNSTLSISQIREILFRSEEYKCKYEK